jgi:DNA-binding NarL/FixJ family response regulator
MKGLGGSLFHKMGTKVFIISRCMLVRTGMRTVLADLAVVVGESSSAGEAAVAPATSGADLVVFDLDGDPGAPATVEGVADIVGSTAAPKVLVLTGSSDPEMLTRAMELGAHGVVMKDQPPQVLVKAIEKVASGEIWLDRREMARVLNSLTQRRPDIELQRIASLTKREREIVALVGSGLRNPAIAERLFISEATVRNHLTSILSKLDLTGRFELAVFAFRHGLARPNGNGHVRPADGDEAKVASASASERKRKARAG